MAYARSGGSQAGGPTGGAFAVSRLMRELGLQGAVRDRPMLTTISDKAPPCPLDRANRQAWAPRPNASWLSDFTHVTTRTGFVYIAFTIECQCQPHHRLAGLAHGPRRVRARCAGTSPRRAAAGTRQRPRPSHRSQRPTRVDRLYRAPRGSGDRAFHGQRR